MIGPVVATLLCGWQPPVTVAGHAVHVYVPAAPGPHSIVVALHGWNQSPELWREKNDLGPLAEKHGAVLAIPAMGKAIYDAGDVETIRAVLAFLREKHGPGPASIIGYSTGGRGALVCAARLPKAFVFAASLSGTYDLKALGPKTGEYRIHAAVFGPRAENEAKWHENEIDFAALKDVPRYVAHGAKDDVVPVSQVDGVKDAIVVPDAGHDWKFWASQWPAVFEQLSRRSR